MYQRELEPDREAIRASDAATCWALGAVLATLAAASQAQTMAPPSCALQFSVEVTPDVPNPADGGFLSSLLGNHTEYQLFLLRSVDDTHVDLQLQGPGPDDRCRAVVDSMSNDGRVQSIRGI
jgi:hypothetical protein